MSDSKPIAKADNWKTVSMPPAQAVLQVDHSFTPDEMTLIQRGLISEVMEGKWFIFYADDTLYMHRSWTGFCIYEAHFVEEGGKFELLRLVVNRNPDQYSSADDAHDAEMFVFLVKALLLGDHTALPPFPPPDQAPEDKRALWLWSMIGRAMFGGNDQPGS